MKWSLEQKLEILATSEENGVVTNCREYEVNADIFYSWKKKA